MCPKFPIELSIFLGFCHNSFWQLDHYRTKIFIGDSHRIFLNRRCRFLTFQFFFFSKKNQKDAILDILKICLQVTEHNIQIFFDIRVLEIIPEKFWIVKTPADQIGFMDFEAVHFILFTRLSLNNSQLKKHVLLQQRCWWQKRDTNIDVIFIHFKGSQNPSHFIFEINVGKSRIRHATTLSLNDAIFKSIFSRFSNSISESF